MTSSGSPIRKSVKTDQKLKDAERQNWGPSSSGTIKDLNPIMNVDPWEGRDGSCAYGAEMDKIYWEDLPIDSEILKSHRQWVSNRGQWSGTSKYLQESIEPTVDWRGIKPGGRGPPEPIPQSCARAEITEYGPSDFATFVTQERRRCGDPVLRPLEMEHFDAPPFSYYGF